jgi:hypothetical protein
LSSLLHSFASHLTFPNHPPAIPLSQLIRDPGGPAHIPTSPVHNSVPLAVTIFLSPPYV